MKRFQYSLELHTKYQNMAAAKGGSHISDFHIIRENIENAIFLHISLYFLFSLCGPIFPVWVYPVWVNLPVIQGWHGFHSSRGELSKI